MDMQSVRFHEYGAADVLRVEDVPTPSISEGEALVEVLACGVNQVDILSRAGATPTLVSLPHISGSEVAGRVASVGKVGRRWLPGTRVVVNPALACGECIPCREARDNLCRFSRVFGVETPGGYAQYVAVPAGQLVELPDGVSFNTAASIAITGSTAWHMLMIRGRLRLGEDLLVVAGGSGIGVMAIQIAKLAGARILATVGSAEKIDSLYQLGADMVINHSEPGWGQQIRDLTNGKGADLVFEHVGAATWQESLRALARNGRLVTCGAHTGSAVAIDLWHLFVKEQELIGSFAATRRDLDHVLTLAADGKLKAVIQAEYALTDAMDAQTRLESRQVIGKLLLAPNGPL